MWANLIPSSSWYSNLRTVLPTKEWNRVRKIVYRRQNYTCFSCGSYYKRVYSNQSRKLELHCHEDWKYNYETHEQVLNQLVSLCYMCHMSNHLGFCEVKLIPEGKISWDELIHHWSEVNSIPKKYFEKNKKLAFELWRIRSSIQWIVVDKDHRVIANSSTLKIF